jgi:hypothetical protein
MPAKKPCPDCGKPIKRQSARCHSCARKAQWRDPEKRKLMLRFQYPDRLSAEQEQVLIGSLLGDGCLCLDYPRGNPNYRETHTEAQKEYLFWKSEILKPFRPSVYSAVRRGDNRMWYISTNRIDLFMPYYRLFYPLGDKVAPDEALARLETLGLAVWFMDDGSLRRRHLVLCTDSWGLEDQRRLAAWFSLRWGVQPSPLYMNHSGNYRLRFRVGDTIKLLELMKPFVHPHFFEKWKLGEPATFQPVMSKSEACAIGNRRRTKLIRAGVLGVRHNQGTVRLKAETPQP